RVVEPEHPAVLVELRPERLPGMAVVALAETEVDRADVVPAVRVGARGDEPLDLSGVGGAARRVVDAAARRRVDGPRADVGRAEGRTRVVLDGEPGGVREAGHGGLRGNVPRHGSADDLS